MPRRLRFMLLAVSCLVPTAWAAQGKADVAFPAEAQGVWTRDVESCASKKDLRGEAPLRITVEGKKWTEEGSIGRASAVTQIAKDPPTWRLQMSEDSEGETFDYTVILVKIGKELAAVSHATVDGEKTPLVHTYRQCG
ncbi:hypothetical protein J8I29_20695 [Labrys sp. LIt4]|uniref:hypothetical protein n=1 Tax=Labrys sp. LIt4 TaxID=2821355 RepID=UPI001ADEDE1F|nr:hypothetical protein [Labrys sp. LIt4]MBP0581759.1 hypothetical protein [Labrys sp. LIt4]